MSVGQVAVAARIHFRCPHCKHGLQVPANFEQHDAICTKCGMRLHLPYLIPAKADLPAPTAMLPPIVAPKEGTLATERQKEFARDLGIEFPQSVTRREISRLIDAKLEERHERQCDATPKQMVHSLHDRGQTAILITFDEDVIHAHGAVESSVCFSDNLEERTMWDVLAKLATCHASDEARELLESARGLVEAAHRMTRGSA